MLKIVIPETEFFNETTQEFINTKGCSIVLEHSLVSISKWEAKWKKPFLNKSRKKTLEETIDYVRCMTITQNVDPNVYYALTKSQYDLISEYINDEMTASWFNEKHLTKTTNSEAVTSDLIYYWMVSYGIPFECQKWHLNRLLTLIRICNVKNQGEKKMSKKDIFSQQKMLNDMRRLRIGSKG